MKLRMSLKKRQGIKILAVLILSFWIPPYIITGYQTLFAEGIYTLELKHARQVKSATVRSEREA